MQIKSMSKMIEEIISHYHFEDQREILVEECAELIQAAQKMRRSTVSSAAFDNFVEELADVTVMVWQMMRYIGPLTVWRKVRYKLRRQIERIEQEVHNNGNGS